MKTKTLIWPCDTNICGGSTEYKESGDIYHKWLTEIHLFEWHIYQWLIFNGMMYFDHTKNNQSVHFITFLVQDQPPDLCSSPGVCKLLSGSRISSLQGVTISAFHTHYLRLLTSHPDAKGWFFLMYFNSISVYEAIFTWSLEPWGCITKIFRP